MQLTEYKNKKILITGGSGYIGSHLLSTLLELGAEMTILTRSPERFVGKKVEIMEGDILDEKILEKAVLNKDFIFNFAGATNHFKSIENPSEDLNVNCRAQLLLLESCRKHNVTTKILFASSRLVYGKMGVNSVTEMHPTIPHGLYGIHKLSAENYHTLYFRTYGIRSVILRITNPYGEEGEALNGKYSLPGKFAESALQNGTIKIFGDGKQLRDYIYITDLVEACLLAALENRTDGETYNCGSGVSISFKKMVTEIIKNIGAGSIEHTPMPPEFQNEETGDFVADISKLQKTINWKPKFTPEEGIKKMCIDLKSKK